MPSRPRTSWPLARMPVPMPSETVTTTRLRQSSMRSNQTAASTQALAAFSSSTSSPVAFAIGIADIQVAPSEVGREHQAVLRVVEAARKADADAFDLLAARATSPCAGWTGSAHRWRPSDRAASSMISCEMKRPLASASATVVWIGAHVHADDDALVVEAEERGTASARQAAGGAFEHPVFLR